MRNLTIVTSLLIAAIFPGVASAKALYGNNYLDYTVKVDHGNVVLIITNKKPSASVNLAAVSLVLPKKNGRESKQMSVFGSPGLPVTTNTTINLGSVTDLAGLMPPNNDFGHYTSVMASENPGCQDIGAGNYECRPVWFGLRIKIAYPGGIVQDGKTDAYLKYLR